MEFICTQELIETDLWSRIYFKYSMRTILKDAAITTKLATINVIASYMIPERITKDEVIKIVTSGSHSKYEELCKDMRSEGMNGRAQRIIQTKQALISNINIEFPKELIGWIYSFKYKE